MYSVSPCRIGLVILGSGRLWFVGSSGSYGDELQLQCLSILASMFFCYLVPISQSCRSIMWSWSLLHQAAIVGHFSSPVACCAYSELHIPAAPSQGGGRVLTGPVPCLLPSHSEAGSRHWPYDRSAGTVARPHPGTGS
uniref:Uncharacterized protein n=1 Tax=Octopus bimaculoides TaxID=37653 RepID=A0A0L8FRE5_OCTBM